MSSGAPIRPGTLLKGRYEVTASLGEGGMGSVHLATDRDLGRAVVVKAPHARFLAEPGFRERFVREVRSLTGLDHPHVVKVYDAGEVEGVPFAVLQHLPGGSLAERMARGPQAPADALAWLVPVAEALDFIHAEGVVHRDVKPANILFDRAGRAHVADFGIAKVLGARDTGLTQTGMTPGSPGYMAPEAVLDAPVTPSYDQYSLAVVVYEALSGRLPHEATNPFRLLTLRATDPPADLGPRAPRVPAGARAAVMRGLERDPARRHASCADFAAAFRAGLSPAPESALGPTAPRPSDGRHHRLEEGRPGGPGASEGGRQGRARLPGLLDVVVWALPLAVLGGVLLLFLGLGFDGESAREQPPPPERAAEVPPGRQARPARVAEGSSEVAPAPPEPPARPDLPAERPPAPPATPPVAPPAAPAESPPAPQAPSEPPAPVLEIDAPPSGALLTVAEVTIRGTLVRVAPGDEIHVNDERVPIVDLGFTFPLRVDPAEGARLRVTVRNGGRIRLALPERQYRYVRPVPLLLEALRSADPKVRREASEDLVRLGSQATSALPALLKLGTASDAAVAEAAVVTLAGLGSVVVPDLIRALSPREPYDGTPAVAQRALVAMGAPVVPALIDAFQDEGDAMQATSLTSPMMALGEIGEPAIPHLCVALQAEAPGHAEAKRVHHAAEALMRVLEAHRGLAARYAKDLVGPLVASVDLLLASPGGFSLYYPIGCLERLGIDSDPVVDALVRVLDRGTASLLDPEPADDDHRGFDALRAIQALAALSPGGRRALPRLRALESAIVAAGPSHLLLDVLGAIAALSGEPDRYVQAVLEYMAGSRSYLRHEPLRRLVALGRAGHAAGPTLRALLEDRKAFLERDGSRDWLGYALAAIAYGLATGDRVEADRRFLEAVRGVEASKPGGGEGVPTLAESLGASPEVLPFWRRAAASPGLDPALRQAIDAKVRELEAR